MAATKLLGDRLPPNCSYGVTRDGRVFFLNDREQTTSWLYPLTGLPVQTGYHSAPGLPQGWEQAVTPEGAIYFIDHNRHMTTFDNPRTGKPTSIDSPPPTRTPPQSPVQRGQVKKTPTKSRMHKAPQARRGENSRVILKGWLHKQESGGLKLWKRKWCVLADFGLFFYKDPSEQQPSGSILLPSYQVTVCGPSTVSKKFAFKLEHENMKTYYLSADSQHEMQGWVETLNMASVLQRAPGLEPNNNTQKLVPKSPIMTWDDEADNGSYPPDSYRDPQGPIPTSDSNRPPLQPRDNTGAYPEEQQMMDVRNAHFDSLKRYPDPQNQNVDPYRGQQRTSRSDIRPALDQYPGQYDGDYNSLKKGQRRSQSELSHSSQGRDGHPDRWGGPYSGHFQEYPDQQLLGDEPQHQRDISDRQLRYPPQEQQMNDRNNPPLERNSRSSLSSRHSSLPSHTNMGETLRQPDNPDDMYAKVSKSRYPNDTLQRGERQGYPNDRSSQSRYPPDSMQRNDNSQGHRNDRLNPLDSMKKNDSWQGHQNDGVSVYPDDVRNTEQQGYPNDRSSQVRYPTDTLPRDSRQSYPNGRLSQSKLAEDLRRDEMQGYPNDRLSQSRYPDNDGQFKNQNDQRRYHSLPGNHDSSSGLRPSDDNSLLTSERRNIESQEQPQKYNAVDSRQRHSQSRLPVEASNQGFPNSQSSPRQGYGTMDRMGQHGPQTGSSGPILSTDNNPYMLMKSPQQLQETSPDQGRQPMPGQENQQPVTQQDDYASLQRVREWQQGSRSEMQAPRSSASKVTLPERPQPNFHLDLAPHTYVNVYDTSGDGHREPGNDLSRIYPQDTAPRRPPLPAAVRQQVVQEIAQASTPQTQKDLLQAEQNLERRMQQPAYFDYPTRIPQDEQGKIMVPWSNPNSQHLGENKDTDYDYQKSPSDTYVKVPFGQMKGGGYGNKRSKGTGLPAIHTVKEDPDMPDSDVIQTMLPKKKIFPLSGPRLRMSICADDLLGKNHDELVLLLIQLRRDRADIEKQRFKVREMIEKKRPTELDYRKRQQEGERIDPQMETEHRRYKDLKRQCEELDKQIEVYKPLVNLVSNMVTMGSLYGGDNLMLATEYRKHLLSPDQYSEPKKMIEFSRQTQEDRIIKEMEADVQQLTKEADLEEKLDRLYELDRLIQEQAYEVTNLKEERDFLEKSLDQILKQQEQLGDNSREMDRLSDQQRSVEKGLSIVLYNLAEASKQLEATTAENNRVEHEVALLRSKVNGDLTRSKSAPSLSSESLKTKLKMEKDLAQVQTMMEGLNKEGARLSEAMNTLRSGATLGKASVSKKETATYNETDLDTLQTKDLAQVTALLATYHLSPTQMSPPSSQNVPTYPVHTIPNQTTPSSHLVYISPDQSETGPVLSQTASVPSRTQQSTFHAFPVQILSSEPSQASTQGQDQEQEMDVADGGAPWDISEADDNTKRFFGLIPKDRPKSQTVRDVKRQSDLRRDKSKKDEPDEVLKISSVPSQYTHSDFPVYENLPKSKASTTAKPWSVVLPNSDNVTGPARRRSLLHLMTPKPFTPFNSQNTLTSVSMTNLGSTRFASEPFIPQIKAFQNSTASTSGALTMNSNFDQQGYPGMSKNTFPQPWEKRDPEVAAMASAKKSSRGRYMTISSTQPIKLEKSPGPTSPTLHTAAGDLITPMDAVPDIVKSSTAKSNRIFDEKSFEKEILLMPEKVEIPERWIPDSDEEEDQTEEEKRKRQDKADKIKKILTQQSIHSISQPDVSKVAGEVHERVQQEKIKRAQLLAIGQELAEQVKHKSREAAAERRKTWSGSPNKSDGVRTDSVDSADDDDDGSYSGSRYNHSVPPVQQMDNFHI